MSNLYQKLENIVSEKFISNDINVRHAYSRNVDVILQGVPDIVIRPKDAQEISEILKIANEENVPVIPRGGAVWRISDVEKNRHINGGIKLASLQHLYFRFLLDIGDSGTHNILMREEDRGASGILIAGIDLEERRTIRAKAFRLDHLFKKPPSKKQVQLYQPTVCKIKSLSYGRLDQTTIDHLHTAEIDLKRLKENMELWNRFN